MSNKVNTPFIIFVGVLSILLLFVIVIGVQAWFRDQELGEEARYVNRPVKGLVEVRSEQLAKINDYRWVDRKNGIAAIPIEQAMKVVVQKEGKVFGPTTAPSAN